MKAVLLRIFLTCLPAVMLFAEASTLPAADTPSPVDAVAVASDPPADAEADVREGVHQSETVKQEGETAPFEEKSKELAVIAPAQVRQGSKDDTLTFPGQVPPKPTEKPNNATGVEHFFFISGRH